MGSQGGGEAETVLRLSNITKRFGPLTANDSVSFELKRGEVILHAAVLRSPYAHAEILSIDASAALALPGVSHVLTGTDIRALSEPFLMVLKLPLDEWALAGDRVRFVAQEITA